MAIDKDGNKTVGWGRNKGKIVNTTYMFAGTNAANYLNPHKIQLDQRRRKVLELRLQGMTLDEIIEYIKEHPEKYLKDGSTSYHPNQLRMDMIAALKTIRDETKEMALEWRDMELARLEEEDDQARTIMEKLYKAAKREDPSLRNIEDYEKLARTFANLQKTVDRIRSRKAKYLPIEMPKKVDIRTQNVYGTVEDYMELRKEADKKSEQIIEGEFEEKA